MPKFRIGDAVVVVYHPRHDYIGIEGTISQVEDILSSNSGPVGPGDQLPPLSNQTAYNVQCAELVGPLTRLHEDWLDFSVNVRRRFAFQCQTPPGDYCKDGVVCSGCRDRYQLIQVVRAQGVDDALTLAFADMVVRSTARPQLYGQVIHNIEIACKMLLSDNPIASNRIQTWIKSDSM